MTTPKHPQPTPGEGDTPRALAEMKRGAAMFDRDPQGAWQSMYWKAQELERELNAALSPARHLQGVVDAVNEAYEKAAHLCDLEYEHRRKMEKHVIQHGGGGMGLEIMHANKAACAHSLYERILNLKYKLQPNT